MKLDLYTTGGFQRGRSRWVELLWLIVQGALVDCWLPGSWHRAWLLRCFGASLGKGVVIKPHVRVKFPWRLVVGDYVWIGEGVWIDNLAEIRIGNHCCISQGAYLCTGSHDARRDSFGLRTSPIVVGDRVWIGAAARVAPGISLANGTLLQMAAVLTRSTQQDGIYAGNPAVFIKQRISR